MAGQLRVSEVRGGRRRKGGGGALGAPRSRNTDTDEQWYPVLGGELSAQGPPRSPRRSMGVAASISMALCRSSHPADVGCDELSLESLSDDDLGIQEAEAAPRILPSTRGSRQRKRLRGGLSSSAETSEDTTSKAAPPSDRITNSQPLSSSCSSLPSVEDATAVRLGVLRRDGSEVKKKEFSRVKMPLEASLGELAAALAEQLALPVCCVPFVQFSVDGDRHPHSTKIGSSALDLEEGTQIDVLLPSPQKHLPHQHGPQQHQETEPPCSPSERTQDTVALDDGTFLILD
ncbi:hypothetical protein cyc_05496 [Cyclospora cayetanensis]|uniref:Uncharacterized protein n=1 Tax=Cyclospora cayetanensis TaxID=88456 RepID=A0A1D3D2N1_9EIME|nr:hypothetical protein cyc_05496 [Cyclospora cayetanensis]